MVSNQHPGNKTGLARNRHNMAGMYPVCTDGTHSSYKTVTTTQAHHAGPSRDPSSLFDMCINLVGHNIDQVESFVGFPSLIGEKIFMVAVETTRFAEDVKYANQALRLFNDAFGQDLMSSLNVAGNHLGLNYCLEQLLVFNYLTALDVSACGLGDDHEVLAHFSHLNSLKYLYLRDNAITDGGVQKMTSSYRMFKKGPAQLHTVDVSGNEHISVKCLKYLSPFEALERVILSNCSPALSTYQVGSLCSWWFERGRCPVLGDIQTNGWASTAVHRWMKHAVTKTKQHIPSKSNFSRRKPSQLTAESLKPGNTKAREIHNKLNNTGSKQTTCEMKGEWALDRDNTRSNNQVGNVVNEENSQRRKTSMCPKKTNTAYGNKLKHGNSGNQDNGEEDIRAMYSFTSYCSKADRKDCSDHNGSVLLNGLNNVRNEWQNVIANRPSYDRHTLPITSTSACVKTKASSAIHLCCDRKTQQRHSQFNARLLTTSKVVNGNNNDQTEEKLMNCKRRKKVKLIGGHKRTFDKTCSHNSEEDHVPKVCKLEENSPNKKILQQSLLFSALNEFV